MTQFNLNNYMAHNRADDGRINTIKCVDGFTISVQASDYHYATLAEDGTGYSHVECGFPSQVPEFIMDYAEDANFPTGTVYGRVPIELVESLITLHNNLLYALIV